MDHHSYPQKKVRHESSTDCSGRSSVWSPPASMTESAATIVADDRRDVQSLHSISASAMVKSSILPPEMMIPTTSSTTTVRTTTADTSFTPNITRVYAAAAAAAAAADYDDEPQTIKNIEGRRNNPPWENYLAPNDSSLFERMPLIQDNVLSISVTDRINDVAASNLAYEAERKETKGKVDGRDFIPYDQAIPPLNSEATNPVQINSVPISHDDDDEMVYLDHRGRDGDNGCNSGRTTSSDDDGDNQNGHLDNKDVADDDHHQKWWEALQLEMMDDPTIQSSGHPTMQHLEQFQRGWECQQKAQGRLKDTYIRVEQMLEQDFHHILVSSMEQFHQQIADPMETLDEQIQRVLQQNHHFRSGMLQNLRKYNMAWEQHSECFWNRILQLDEQVESGPRQQSGTQTGVPPVYHLEDKHVQDMGHGHDKFEDDTNAAKRYDHENQCNEADSDDPNWEEMKQYEPSRERIGNFLQGRVRWQQAHERFTVVVQDLLSDIKDNYARMLQDLAKVITLWNEEHIELQMSIQERIGENFHQRKQLETAIARAAEHQQGMFASLFARIGSAHSRTSSLHSS